MNFAELNRWNTANATARQSYRARPSSACPKCGDLAEAYLCGRCERALVRNREWIARVRAERAA